MRVIAGKARRLNLKTIEGLDTRPTTDRIKETLFNMINDDVYCAVFIDMFAGSGGIGIEALSRGANKAYFIENNKAAVKCIKENLAFTKLSDDAVVMETDVLTAVNRLEGKIVADIIFMDPPYNNNYETEVLNRLSASNILTQDTLIIIESSLDTDFEYAKEIGFCVIKEKIYKTNKHVFLRREK